MNHFKREKQIFIAQRMKPL